MKASSNLGVAILKATLMTTIIFWLFVFYDDFDLGMIPYILLSIIPISIICSLTILFTIMPFFWFLKNNTSKKIIFEKYFPFYSIMIFLLFLYAIVISRFQEYVIAFFMSAFFILIQSWIWLCKPDINQKIS
jgi:hypothetical protein